jgi:putative PIN family toxin of toxin-antitoxin system
VLVAAAANREGRPARSVNLVVRSGIPILTDSGLRELIDVLARRYFADRLAPAARAAFIASLARVAHIVEPTETIRACRDAKDDKFLEAAVAGSADCIVTGDADLLALNPFRGIRIVVPSVFLATYEGT